jgi:hypothetical protein
MDLASAARLGGVAALALWLVGVSGAFSPAVNWTAITVGVALIAASDLSDSD